MISKKVSVGNPTGIDQMTAIRFAQACMNANSEVSVTRPDMKSYGMSRGTSIVYLASLNVKQGDIIQISMDCENEEELFASLMDILNAQIAE